MKTPLFISTKIKEDKEKKYLMKNAAFSCAYKNILFLNTYLIFVSLVTEPADFVYANGFRSLLFSILFVFAAFAAILIRIGESIHDVENGIFLFHRLKRTSRLLHNFIGCYSDQEIRAQVWFNERWYYYHEKRQVVELYFFN